MSLRSTVGRLSDKRCVCVFEREREQYRLNKEAFAE